MDSKLEVNLVWDNEDKTIARLTFLAPGSEACPVAVVALGGVVPLQHVAVTTLATDSKQLICMREIISNNT